MLSPSLSLLFPFVCGSRGLAPAPFGLWFLTMGFSEMNLTAQQIWRPEAAVQVMDWAQFWDAAAAGSPL